MNRYTNTINQQDEFDVVAIRLDGPTDATAIAGRLGATVTREWNADRTFAAIVFTHRGDTVRIRAGHWLVRTHTGAIYECEPDLFATIYREKVPA